MAFFLYSDVSAQHFSASSLAGDEPENLQSMLPSMRWVAGSASEDALLVTGSAAWEADTVALMEHDLDGVEVTLQAADDAAFTTNVRTVTTFTPAASSSIHISTFTADTARYWRLEPSSAYQLRLACLYIGKRLETVTNQVPAFNDADDVEFFTQATRAVDGTQLAAQSFIGAKRFQCMLRYQTDAFRDSFVQLVVSTRGDLRPFYFVSDSSGSMFCRFAGGYTPVTAAQFDRTEIQQLTLIGASADTGARGGITLSGIISEPVENVVDDSSMGYSEV